MNPPNRNRTNDFLAESNDQMLSQAKQPLSDEAARAQRLEQESQERLNRIMAEIEAMNNG